MRHRPKRCPKCGSKDIIILQRNLQFVCECAENIFRTSREAAKRDNCGYDPDPDRDYCGYAGPWRDTEGEAVEDWNEMGEQ